jgi:hypothetical protein
MPETVGMQGHPDGFFLPGGKEFVIWYGSEC